MRIIKFRAWDKEDEKFFEPVYEAYKGELSELVINFNGCLTLRTMDDFRGTQDRYILMQFTGLNDKNGKEVYRGDVVAFKYNPGNNNPIFKGREYNALVEWDSCNPCFVLVEIGPAKRREYDFVMAGLLTLEVIGNEWENPELLK